MKKRQVFLPLLILLSLALTLCGCGKTEPTAAVAEPTPEATAAPMSGDEIVRAFLEIYLTADYEGRYTDYLAALENGQEEEKIQEDYHACVRSYLTDEMYEKMCRNRTMLRYDEMAAKQGATMSAVEIDTFGCPRGGKGTFFANVSPYWMGIKYHTLLDITGEVTLTDDGAIKNIVFWYQEPIPESIAFSESGRETAAAFFREYYTRKAESRPDLDFSHMNLAPLANMASSTVGTVVDTNELRIEVLGALFNGNMAEIMLLVTAKELESVIPEGNTDPKYNYRFENDTTYMYTYTLDDRIDTGWAEYIYSDTDETLASNQFKLHIKSLSNEPITKEIFSIPLVNFGCYSKGAGRMRPLYEDSWQVDIAIDTASGSNTLLRPREQIRIGEYPFTVEDIQITPLGGIVHLTCQEELAYVEEHQDEINRVYFEGYDSFTLTLSDGTRLVKDAHFWTSASAGLRSFTLDFLFHGPVAVEDIASITLFGREFSL